jgi:uncharacterized membrane protein YjjB (DUF3815 family)
MDALLTILLKSLWCGAAAVGFGVLFNTPTRSLIAIYAGGMVAGLVKYSALGIVPDAGVIISSFIAALVVGFLSIPMAHLRHVPPVVFSIPSIIPLVPGVYAYRTMLGLMRLTKADDENFVSTIQLMTYNAVNTLFVVMVIAIGVVLPMYVLRKESVKNIRW